MLVIGQGRDHKAQDDRLDGKTKDQHTYRKESCDNQGRHRYEAGSQNAYQATNIADQRYPDIKAEHSAHRGRHALATFKAHVDGEIVAQNNAEAAIKPRQAKSKVKTALYPWKAKSAVIPQNKCAHAFVEQRADIVRQNSFQKIADKYDDAGLGAHDARHVGHARVAAAIIPYINITE